MESLCRSLFSLLIFGLIAIIAQQCADSQHPDSTAACSPECARQWVELLGHQTYQSRERARRVLTQIGPSDAVREALTGGLRSSSLEVRQASLRLLQQFELQTFDRELQRLASPEVSPSDVRLVGWQDFSAIAGDDHWSRKLYGRIARRHHAFIDRLVNQCSAPGMRNQNPDGHRSLSSGNDGRGHLGVLLFSDSLEVELGRPDLSACILNALGHSGLGPIRVSGGDRLVIERLVDHWIGRHSRLGNGRERLIVAMRYDCKSRAGQLCRQTLADDSAAASALVTAMLCASVLGEHDLRSQLTRRLEDDRTSHVWQLIAASKTKIRTQVRDVALALLLHDDGIDPRQVGFVELQADPLLLFREHSLGFADDQSRQTAHQQGRGRLGI